MNNFVARLPSRDTGETEQREHADLHPLFAAYPVPSLLYGADGVVAEANDKSLELFRCGRAQLVGSTLSVFMPELRGDLAVSQGVTHQRVAVRRPDGNNFIARVHFVPTNTGRGLWLATIEDLSDWEQEVAAANKELETFMSAAGHDLRGPLRILKGFSEALEEECADALNEEGRGFLKEILRAADRLDGLIDALLALSRAGRAEMTCENLDLTTLAELALYELRHAKDARDVDVQVEPGLTAWGDTRLMMVVLRTLLGNAWKYTGRTERPMVRFHAETREGRTWLCVSDNGAGFDMAQSGRLFQPFTRLHRQDEFAGHGLGLATVRRIVRRHGGEVEAEAAPNQGATIRFWLAPSPN